MRLIELEVTDFRAFRHAVLPLPSSGVGLVVGQNNAGKTALLSAIDVLSQRQPQDDHTTHAGSNIAIVSGTFTLDMSERERVLRELNATTRYRDAWLEGGLFSRVRIVMHQRRGQGQFQWRELYVEWPGAGLQPFIRPSAGQGANTWEVSALPQMLQADTPPTVGSHTSPSREDGREQVTSWSPTHAFNHLLGEWQKTVYHFLALRSGTQRQRPINATPSLEPTGVNLAEALAWVHSNDEATWSAIRRVIGELVPEIGTLHVPLTGNATSVIFEDASGHRRNLKDLGTGVEQLLLTTYVGLAQPSASLIVVEEPETNLHPDAQRRLFSYLHEWSAGRQIIAATHSSVFLDRASRAAASVALVERRAGISTVHLVTTRLPDALRALGVRPGDVLSADALLLVEGPSDAQVLEHWFGSALTEDNIAVLPTGGSDRAWSAADFERFAAESNALPQPVLYLRDRDELSDSAIAKLQAGPVRVLPVRELENFFLDPHLLSAALAERLQANGRPADGWTPQHIDARVPALAEQTRIAVVVKRVASELRSIRPLSRDDVRSAITSPDPAESLAASLDANLAPARDAKRLIARQTLLVDRLWPSAWRSLAPGADVLALLWREAGLRYDKTKDTIALARRIEPPQAVAAVIEELRGHIRDRA